MAVFQVGFMAESLGRTVPIIVILPTDKVYFPGMPRREEGKPYKTLYLLHGIVGDCTDWLYGTRIRRWAEENLGWLKIGRDMRKSYERLCAGV